MEEEYIIRADDLGKKKYWDHTHGLHSGYGGKYGYQIFHSKKDANKVVRLLEKVFAGWYKFEILPDTEIPFIKKQITKNKTNQKQKTK